MKEQKSCCDIDMNKKDCCVDEVGEMIQRLVRVLNLFERDQIKIYGFTTSQCNVLLELKKAESLTMSELSEKMNLNTSTMTRVLDNMVRDGYILRERNEKDRRVVTVRLSETGKEMAEKLGDSVTDYYRKIIEGIPEGQLEQVLQSVSLLQRAFEKANPNCC